MIFRYSVSISSLLIVFLVSGLVLPVHAEVTGADVLARRAELEQDLAALEREIEAQRAVLQEKQREKVSLERDIAILDAKIQSAELSIRARNLVIERLSRDIVSREITIGDLSEKLSREKESLAELIRRTHEIDSYTIVEVVLANRSLSDFFQDLDSFGAISASLQASFREIGETKDATERERNSLADKRSEEQELRRLQEIQKQRIESDKGLKRRLLAFAAGQEAEYLEVVNAKEKDAAAIRSELFALRGSDAIPFEQALELANFAARKTGVRAALILGVIAEESNLGENVGTGTWLADMHPTRDRPIFEEITRKLGYLPDAMPVSKKPWYGWGGAMGPAQFIPSTWVLYEDRVAAAVGVSIADPWKPRDAFAAAALLLKDNGASNGSYAAERLAALRYFAGWQNATKPSYAFYGDEVMELAAKYQRQIDILGSS
ncbi:MAG: lytic murein transglycosylase [Parcubacteria group bacterium]|nr:lytic murein transglycosylase [Parcubacteria group bacterium]